MKCTNKFGPNGAAVAAATAEVSAADHNDDEDQDDDGRAETSRLFGFRLGCELRTPSIQRVG